MAAVAAADAGATAGMRTADAPSEPGTVLRAGRDAAGCRLVTPADWLSVSRVHLEFRCGPDGAWTLTWLRGSRPGPSAEVRLMTAGRTRPVAHGGTAPLPPGVAAARSSSRTAEPRGVNVGFYHDVRDVSVRPTAPTPAAGVPPTPS